MIKRKSIVLLTLIVIFIFTVSCNKDYRAENAVTLLTSIYEVENYEFIERVLEEKKNFISSELNSTGLVSLDLEVAKNIYKPYIDKYSPYTTTKGLESLFMQGIATYMDLLAYSNEFYTEVEGVDLKERKSISENLEYSYTIRFKFIKGDKSMSAEGSGIVGFGKTDDNEYKINFIKRTDSATINKNLKELVE